MLDKGNLLYCVISIILFVTKETWYWDSSNVTEIMMSGVKCLGDEMTLTECQHHSVVSCKRASAAFAAGVICTDCKSYVLCIATW